MKQIAQINALFLQYTDQSINWSINWVCKLFIKHS